jgi:hypothetical protein
MGYGHSMTQCGEPARKQEDMSLGTTNVEMVDQQEDPVNATAVAAHR